MIKKFLCLSLIAVSAVWSTSCTDQTDRDPHGGTLVLGMIADIQRADPHRQTGNPSNQVFSLITESLVSLDDQGLVSLGIE